MAGETRRVLLGQENSACVGHNRLVTSKFTLLDFLPLALFAQFRRLANFYYVLISALMVLGTYSPLFQSPYSYSTTLGPLLVLMSLSIFKEGLSDLERHRADRDVDRTLVEILNRRGAALLWEIRPGDVVKVKRGEIASCDFVVLAGAGEANTCHIDTASIDGETNLKLRRGPATTASLGSGDEAKVDRACAALASGVIECDVPNEHVNVFNGTISGVDGGDGGVVPLSRDHVVLRGSTVHSAWVVGICVYSGPETKLALNTRQPPLKFSQLDRLANRAMLLQLGCQAVLAAISAIAMTSFNAGATQHLWYAGYRVAGTSAYLDARWDDLEWSSKSLGGFWGFVTFFVLYCNYIPMSLYVAFDVATAVQTLYVGWDAEMRHTMADGTTFAAVARSGTVTDLGQVEFVFSDKTGTLTCNEMKLRRLMCNGDVFDVPAEKAEAEKQEAAFGEAQPPRPISHLFDSAARDCAGGLAVVYVGDHAAGASPNDAPAAPCPPFPGAATPPPMSSALAALRLLESLMLCHTVLVEQEEQAAGGVVYQAESPDEGALVLGAKAAGYELRSRSERVLGCRVGSGSAAVEAEWEILATNAFDNDRKRMSIFLRRGGRIVLYCKGADAHMFDRAADDWLLSPAAKALRATVDGFATAGLRTLVFGARDWSEAEFARWRDAHYAPASAALHGREELLRAAADACERDLEIVGASAIEDMLQDGVPETIATLRAAAVKLWVLTGDKRETAVEIAKSCRLITQGMRVDVLSEEDGGDLELLLYRLYRREFGAPADRREAAAGFFEQLRDSPAAAHVAALCDRLAGRAAAVAEAEAVETKIADLEARSGGADARGKGSAGGGADGARAAALVLDGGAVRVLFALDAAVQVILCRLLSRYGAVLAVRVTPKQKAQFVHLVQDHVRPKPVTLAIGDGANDVNMIMSAQIGVGISGLEGRQAVNASDFAIAQFRFLQRLMLHHGRTNYRRNCKLILYSFYKNACLAMLLFFFSFDSGFSGTSFFHEHFTASYNFYLFCVIFWVAMFDRDVEPIVVEKHPRLYDSGRLNQDLGVGAVLFWQAQSVAHSLLLFYLPTGALKMGTGARVDVGHSLFASSTVVATGLVVFMNLKAYWESAAYIHVDAACGECGGLGAWGFLASNHVISVLSWAFYLAGTAVASTEACVSALDGFLDMWPYRGVGTATLGVGTTWLVSLLVLGAIIIADFLVRAVKHEFFVDAVTLEIERQELLRPGATHRARVAPDRHSLDSPTRSATPPRHV